MKLIPNSKGYYVSEQGFVYRGERKLGTNRDNYLDVTIFFTDGSKKNMYVHRVVAQVWIPNPENKPIVNHKDGVKHNNAVSNLEWVTAKENSQHALTTGLVGTGLNSKQAIRTEEEIHEICKLLEDGYRVCDVVKKTGIPQSTVSLINTRKLFTDISSAYRFSPRNRRALSEETVRWVCHLLEEGKRHNEIISLSTCHALNKGHIDMLLHKLAYKDIVKDYSF